MPPDIMINGVLIPFLHIYITKGKIIRQLVKLLCLTAAWKGNWPVRPLFRLYLAYIISRSKFKLYEDNCGQCNSGIFYKYFFEIYNAWCKICAGKPIAYLFKMLSLNFFNKKAAIRAALLLKSY